MMSDLQLALFKTVNDTPHVVQSTPKFELDWRPHLVYW